MCRGKNERHPAIPVRIPTFPAASSRAAPRSGNQQGSGAVLPCDGVRIVGARCVAQTSRRSDVTRSGDHPRPGSCFRKPAVPTHGRKESDHRDGRDSEGAERTEVDRVEGALVSGDAFKGQAMENKIREIRRRLRCCPAGEAPRRSVAGDLSLGARRQNPTPRQGTSDPVSRRAPRREAVGG